LRRGRHAGAAAAGFRSLHAGRPLTLVRGRSRYGVRAGGRYAASTPAPGRTPPMVISLKPSHLKRYKDVARLFIKYGRSDVVREAGLDEGLLELPADAGTQAEADQLARDLEALGPTFIKLGQLLSTRAEFL